MTVPGIDALAGWVSYPSKRKRKRERAFKRHQGREKRFCIYSQVYSSTKIRDKSIGNRKQDGLATRSLPTLSRRVLIASPARHSGSCGELPFDFSGLSGRQLKPVGPAGEVALFAGRLAFCAHRKLGLDPWARPIGCMGSTHRLYHPRPLCRNTNAFDCRSGARGTPAPAMQCT